jgi:hypothetical protein
METDTRDSPRQDRREFVNAVAEHLWVRPGTDRPVVKPPILLLLTALAAAGALATGLILHMLHRNDPPPANAAPPPPAAAPAVWTAVSGWDCAGDDTRGFTASGRSDAWYTVPDGGWDKDGCNGSFAAVPMSGSAKDDPTQSAQWSFTPGDAYDSCELSAYSPKVVRLQDSAGTAVHYALLDGRSGTPMADVTVNAPASAGRWAVIGTYPVSADGLTVRMTNRGQPRIADGRIAVAQFRVRCTG